MNLEKIQQLTDSIHRTVDAMNEQCQAGVHGFSNPYGGTSYPTNQYGTFPTPFGWGSSFGQPFSGFGPWGNGWGTPMFGFSNPTGPMPTYPFPTMYSGYGFHPNFPTYHRTYGHFPYPTNTWWGNPYGTGWGSFPGNFSFGGPVPSTMMGPTGYPNTNPMWNCGTFPGGSPFSYYGCGPTSPFPQNTGTPYGGPTPWTNQGTYCGPTGFHGTTGNPNTGPTGVVDIPLAA